MQSLELLLDDTADARVRVVWRALADRGLPSQADHRGASNAPHITLFAQPEVPVPDTAPDELPLAITLGPAVVLGAGPRRSVAASVVPTQALLALQATFAGGDGFFAVGQWTPHVTLARRVPTDAIGPVLEEAAALDGVGARAVALRHWDSETTTVTPIPSARPREGDLL